MSLVDDLTAASATLTERVLAEMYENPFWTERFGERGNKHGRQDGHYHVKYVVEALRANDPAVIEHYARWLQQVLTTRGMCTRHLDENFERLARAIADTIPDGAPAITMLEFARRALRYADGPQRVLQEHIAPIAELVTERLFARHSEWPSDARTRCADDVVTHVHYAADALALGMPKIWHDYLTWIGPFLARHRAPCADLDEVIAAMRVTCRDDLGVALP